MVWTNVNNNLSFDVPKGDLQNFDAIRTQGCGMIEAAAEGNVQRAAEGAGPYRKYGTDSPKNGTQIGAFCAGG